MRRTAGLCAFALALPIAGCGTAAKNSSTKFKGPDKAVATTVENLETAGRKNDPTRACTQLFAPALLAQIKTAGRNCDTAVKEAFSDADALDLTVDAVAVKGTTATARVTEGTGTNKETTTVSLALQGKAWKLTSLGS